jgi:hypothetical protein
MYIDPVAIEADPRSGSSSWVGWNEGDGKLRNEKGEPQGPIYLNMGGRHCLDQTT